MGSTGFHFLMETAGIVDLVINTMSLTFVLSLDEMIFDRLATKAAKHIMESLEDLALFDTSLEEQESQADTMKRYTAMEFGRPLGHVMSMVLPRKLLMIIVFMLAF